MRSLDGSHRLLYAVDTDLSRAQRLCAQRGEGTALADWRQAVSDGDVELVIVSTINSSLAEIACAALSADKHVLVEKPAGRNPEEIGKLIDAQKKSKAYAKVGFNHRFHPAMQKAYSILRTGELGEFMFIRGRYGHGGRLGYEKEWRFDKSLSGGGELLDQGVHLIDLSRWLSGEEFTRADGYTGAFFWDAPLEDNGFMLLRTERGHAAWLHASATEWKNMFSLEIYCKTGKLQIDGLGGSYSAERLTLYRMLPQMGPPETTAWEYPFPDMSWKAELDYFTECITNNVLPEGNVYDAEKAMEIVYQIYGANR